MLFADTFNNAFEPEVAHDALTVLASCRLHRTHRVPGDGSRRPLCCGRTFLATGLVDQAKVEARRTLEALMPHVERGATVVGLEPSCLLSMRDEFLVMGLGESAQRLASNALLIEEFLAREHRAGKLNLPLKPLHEKRALVHGHCHQKAFDALAPTIEVLKLIPDLQVDVIDSSCCGMAGAFGYEASHYGISMKMAELSLLPAVRAADRETLIVADGTSCRHQIADGTRDQGARAAVHAIRLLARALAAH